MAVSPPSSIVAQSTPVSPALSDSVFLHTDSLSRDAPGFIHPSVDSVFRHSKSLVRDGAAAVNPPADSAYTQSNRTYTVNAPPSVSPSSDSVFVHGNRTYNVEGLPAPNASDSAFSHPNKTYTAEGVSSTGLSATGLSATNVSDSVFRRSNKTYTVDGTVNLAQLQEENVVLRSRICDLEMMTQTQAERIMVLEKVLEENRVKEEKQALDLESIEKYVENTLELMTKQRAAKADEITKLRQENAELQVELRNCRQGRAPQVDQVDQVDLPAVTQNAEAALQHLCRITASCREAIRQLLSEAETLQLIIDILKSIDKFSNANRRLNTE